MGLCLCILHLFRRVSLVGLLVTINLYKLDPCCILLSCSKSLIFPIKTDSYKRQTYHAYTYRFLWGPRAAWHCLSFPLLPQLHKWRRPCQSGWSLLRPSWMTGSSCPRFSQSPICNPKSRKREDGRPAVWQRFRPMRNKTDWDYSGGSNTEQAWFSDGP